MNLLQTSLKRQKMNMNIKIISFDIGGTLITEHNKNNLSNLLKLPYENVRKVYKDIF